MSAITSGLSVTAHSGGAEWANYLLFFYHADGSASIRGIDLYQRSGFVLEAKEGSDQMNAPELTLFCVP